MLDLIYRPVVMNFNSQLCYSVETLNCSGLYLLHTQFGGCSDGMSGFSLRFTITTLVEDYEIREVQQGWMSARRWRVYPR